MRFGDLKHSGFSTYTSVLPPWPPWSHYSPFFPSLRPRYASPLNPLPRLYVPNKDLQRIVRIMEAQVYFIERMKTALLGNMRLEKAMMVGKNESLRVYPNLESD